VLFWSLSSVFIPDKGESNLIQSDNNKLNYSSLVLLQAWSGNTILWNRLLCCVSVSRSVSICKMWTLLLLPLNVWPLANFIKWNVVKCLCKLDLNVFQNPAIMFSLAWLIYTCAFKKEQALKGKIFLIFFKFSSC